MTDNRLPVAQRPAGDLLEEVVSRGASGFARYLGQYGSLAPVNRSSVLLGGLALGPDVATEWRARLSSRDSAEKNALAFGLGEIGHPDAEAYLARVVRERPSAEAAASALRGLGRIRSPRTFPLVLRALEDDVLFPAACEALAQYGGKEAVGALLARAADPPAFRALADLGASEARELFLASLEQEDAPRAEAARGIGRLGDASLGLALLPHLESEDEALLRAAWEAYVALRAPEGAAPLVQRARTKPSPWMFDLLARVDSAETHAFFVELFQTAAPTTFWRKLWPWKRARSTVDRRTLLHGLRGAGAPPLLPSLLASLRSETDPLAAAEILKNRLLSGEPGYEGVLLELWRSESLVFTYLAGRASLRNPSVSLLAEALSFLSRPGFCGFDGASPLADPEHTLRVFAQENNPFLLLGGFLDSGHFPMEELVRALEQRLANGAFPPETAPETSFAGVEGCGLGPFFEAFGAALPAHHFELARLWNLLAQLRIGSDTLLDLFLSHAGVHRAGLQRLILRELPAALGQLVAGKDDRFLSQLDRLTASLPADPRLRTPVAQLLERCRRVLMAECRDMVLFSENMPKGDMVLIAQL